MNQFIITYVYLIEGGKIKNYCLINLLLSEVMVLFCLSHTSDRSLPPKLTPHSPSIYSPGRIFPKCNREGQFTPCLIYVLQGNPSLCMVHVLHSIRLPSFGLLCKVQYLSMQLHILATAYFFLAFLRESSKPEEQIQMFLNLASLIQNSRWQDFTWKCTRLTQHLFLLTSHFYDQRFWSLPPLLSRKNSTSELNGKRLSIIVEKYLICFSRHAEEGSLAFGVRSGMRAGATAADTPESNLALFNF